MDKHDTRMTLDQTRKAIEQGLGRATELLMIRFNMDFDTALLKAKTNREARRQTWLETAIDPLAKKHGTTREAVISLLFFDNTGSGPTTKDAHWVEANDFASMTFVAAGLKPGCLVECACGESPERGPANRDTDADLAVFRKSQSNSSSGEEMRKHLKM